MVKKAYAENGMVSDWRMGFSRPLWHWTHRSGYKKTIRQGEERLMFAVLESAVEDFQKYVLARKPSGKKLFQEAEEWFLDKDSDELFSFENICETL
jgi:hypothetical protein